MDDKIYYTVYSEDTQATHQRVGVETGGKLPLSWGGALLPECYQRESGLNESRRYPRQQIWFHISGTCEK